MKLNKNRKNNKKIVSFVMATALVVALITTYTVVAYQKSFWPFMPDQTTINEPNNDINYDPPTQQEIEDSQDAKKNNLDDDEDNDSPTSTSGNLRHIEVGVAFADEINGQIEIRAFTPSVVESDGICTATLTKNSATVTKSSQAFIDSTTSVCQPIKIALSEFQQSGDWSLVVSYKSSKSQGKSEIIEVRVP